MPNTIQVGMESSDSNNDDSALTKSDGGSSVDATCCDNLALVLASDDVPLSTFGNRNGVPQVGGSNSQNGFPRVEMEAQLGNRNTQSIHELEAPIGKKDTLQPSPQTGTSLAPIENRNSLQTIPQIDAILATNGNSNILQTATQIEAPKISSLNLSSCNAVQIGTRIITSNLTMLGDGGRITLQQSQDSDSNGERTFNETTIVLSKLIKGFACVLLVFLGVLTWLVLRLGYVSNDGERFVDSATKMSTNSATEVITHLPNTTKSSSEVVTDLTFTTNPHVTSSTQTQTTVWPSWLITRSEWGSANVSCTPDLETVNTIKLVSGFNCGSMSCSNKINRSQQLAISVLGRKDVEFHFAINAVDGATYEGRVHSCQTEYPYGECGKSFLIIRLYRDEEEEDPWYDDHGNKLIGSLVQLVKFGQNESFIYGKFRADVVMQLAQYWENQYFTQKLKTFFKNITFYETDYDRSCS